MAMQAGQIIDAKYRVVRVLGTGSMGAVYEGENTAVKRRVAIKVLHPGVATKESTVKRFEREAQAAGRIGSDHIVEVLDLGSLGDGSYYMVMEYLEGISLRDRLKERGRLSPREVVPIVQQILTGLEAAHDARIIHRDLKPDNVFLLQSKAGQSDFVKILDFGVSKFHPLNAEETMDLTKAGTVVGTPFYMSPEQAKGARDIDARSDLYSVGIMLYECVTGQKPFHAGTFNELIFKIVLDTPPPPEEFVPDLDPAFSRIVRKAMSRTADDRFQSAAEMREALSVWLHTGDDELAATQLMDPLPPPPTPGRAVGPPPRLRPAAPADETDEEQAATQIIEPGEAPEAPTRIVSRPPPPPLVPQDLIPTDDLGRVTDRPFRPTDIPGVASSASRRMVAIAVGVAAGALALGGIAAVVWTSAGSAAKAEPAALAPAAETTESAAEEPGHTVAGTDDSGEQEPGDDESGEVEPEETEIAASEPHGEPARTPPAPPPPPPRPKTASKPKPPQTEPGSPPSQPHTETPPPNGTSPGSPTGKPKGKGKSGRTIATEL